MPVMTEMKDELCSNTHMLQSINGKLTDMDTHQLSAASAAAAVIVAEKVAEKVAERAAAELKKENH